LSLVSGLGRCGPGRFGCFYGVLSSDGQALVLVGVLAFVSGMVLGSMSGLGRCGAGRFVCFYGALRSGGRALLLDKQ
ncbi:hypothetical protein ACFU9X_47115, partial [Streptomyces atratus]|uniref:hypothetical protein n=1 Tax=Streptomyces atratus TaxID=1893 RepID=UPI0036749A79